MADYKQIARGLYFDAPILKKWICISKVLDGKNVRTEPDYRGSCFTIPIHALNPIPLDMGWWIKKFGFKHSRNNEYVLDIGQYKAMFMHFDNGEENPLDYDLVISKQYDVVCKLNTKTIEHVHALQLIFAALGIHLVVVDEEKW